MGRTVRVESVQIARPPGRLLSPLLGPMVRSGLKKDLEGSEGCWKTVAGRASGVS